jgi:hypothetical protein
LDEVLDLVAVEDSSRLRSILWWNQPQTEAEQKQALVDYRKALEEELEISKSKKRN